VTANASSSGLAQRIADLVKVDAPWEVVGERSSRFEVHLNGTSVELERGPITVEGYGLRIFRPHGEGLGTGFQASTNLHAEGVRAAADDAEAAARYAEFPARSVSLPSAGRPGAEVPVVDPKLWADPATAVRSFVEALLAPFRGRKGVVPTFGSVKATLSDLSIANSEGLHVAFPSTSVEVELGVKAFGGAEGAPPGEFWVNQLVRRLESGRVAPAVDDWCRYAEDVRHAVNPPNGDQAVVLPPEVLAGILPPVLGYRFTGAARLRKVAPSDGATVAASSVTVRDEGDFAWGPGSGPYDDEGTPQGKRTLIDRGVVGPLLYDALYGSAFSTKSTGNGVRTTVGPTADLRFAHRPAPGATTLVVAPGEGGTLEELAESAAEGILVTQLGWANPDPISGTFGGEIRIGYRIHRGKLAEPVRGGTVGGVVLTAPGAPSLLASTEAIGSRPELADRLSSPPMLVRPLSVAGA